MAFDASLGRDAQILGVLEACLFLGRSIPLVPVESYVGLQPILGRAMAALAADAVVKPDRGIRSPGRSLGYARIDMAAQTDFIALGMDLGIGSKALVIPFDVAADVAKEDAIGFLMRVLGCPDRVFAPLGIVLDFDSLVEVAVMASRGTTGADAGPVGRIA